MKAVRIHQTGGPEVLTFEDVPTPTPGPGEVLIKVAAAGINFADLMARQGVYPSPNGLPAILGFEVAGTVAAIGEGVTTPDIGARVVGISPSGGYAEYAVAPAASMVPIPDLLDFPAATAVFLQGLTAYGLLQVGARLQPGETVLVHAAAGGVGSLAIQLAKLLGAGRVIGTTSAEEKLDLVQRLGADAAINYREPNWAEQINTLTDGQGVDIILDGVGGEIGAQSPSILAPRGRIVVYGSASGQPTMIAGQALMFKGQSLIGYSMGAQTPPEEMAANIRSLLGYVTEGQLQITVGQTFPLAEAAAAHQAIAERSTVGKVVLLVE